MLNIRHLNIKNQISLSKIIISSSNQQQCLLFGSTRFYSKKIVGGSYEYDEYEDLNAKRPGKLLGLDEDRFDGEFKERNKKVEKAKRVFNQKKKKRVSALDVFLEETQNEVPQVDLVDGDQIHIFPPPPKSHQRTGVRGIDEIDELEEQDESEMTSTEDHGEFNAAQEYDFSEDYHNDFNKFSREFDEEEDQDIDDDETFDNDPIDLETQELIEKREQDEKMMRKLEREKERKRKQFLLEAGFNEQDEIVRASKQDLDDETTIDEDDTTIGASAAAAAVASTTTATVVKKKYDKRSTYIKYQIFSKVKTDIQRLSQRLFDCDRIRGLRTSFNDDVLEEKEIQVVDVDGTRLGLMTGPKAYRLAYVKKLDIFLSYGSKNIIYGRLIALEDYIKILERKAKQEVEKKENVAIKSMKSVLISSNISENDRDTKFASIKKFLIKRHSVEVTITFKGEAIKEEGEAIFSLLTPELHGIGRLQSHYEKEGGKIISRFYQPLTIRDRDAHLKRMEREEMEKQKKQKERLEREEIDRLEELGQEVDPVKVAATVAATIKKLQIQQELAQENIYGDFDFEKEDREKERKRKEREEKLKLEPIEGEGLTNKQIKQNKNKNKKKQSKNKNNDEEEESF